MRVARYPFGAGRRPDAKLRWGRFAIGRSVRTAMSLAALAAACGVYIDLVYDAADRELTAQEQRSQRAFDAAYDRLRAETPDPVE